MKGVGHDLAETGASRHPIRRALFRRLLPLSVILGAFAAILVFDLDRYFTFEALRENHSALKTFVTSNELTAALAFMAIYAVCTATSVPGGTVLSIAGGFLFGPWLGIPLVVVSATVGATAIFVAARTAFGDVLRRRAGSRLKRMEEGFRKNAFSYLLFLRLVPVFPFFVVNLVPAFLGVTFTTYVVATFFGIIPGAFVFSFTGAGLGNVLASDQPFSPASVLTPEVVIGLTGLGVLSLLPILVRRLKVEGKGWRRRD